MLLPATGASARPGCHTTRCTERVARKQCSQARPVPCVTRAILTYRLTGWQAAWMRRIPRCESTWNPLAYFPSSVARTSAQRRAVEASDTSAGLYAFKPSTFRGTPYGQRHGTSALWRAKYSALAAAWMVRQGRTGEWACT